MRTADQPPATPEHFGVPLLIEELADQSHKPPGDEPAIAAFCAAAHHQAETNPAFRNIINDLVSSRHPLSADEPRPEINRSELAEEIRGIVIATEDIENPFFNYSEIDEAKQWSAVINCFVSEYREGNQAKALIRSIRRAIKAPPNLGSTMPAELVIQSMRERYNGRLNILSLNSNTKLHNWLFDKTLFTQEFEVVTFDGSNITQQSNRLLGAPSLADKITYVDSVEATEQNLHNDSSAAKYAFRGLMLPGERADPKIIKGYNRVFSNSKISTDHYVADFSKADDTGQTRAQEEKYDLILAGPGESRETLKHMSSLLSDNGLLIVTGFAYTNPAPKDDQPVPTGALRTYARWHKTPYRYATYVYDNHPAQPKKGFVEAMRLRDSRCKDARIGSGRLALNGELWPLSDLIANA